MNLAAIRWRDRNVQEAQAAQKAQNTFLPDSNKSDILHPSRESGLCLCARKEHITCHFCEIWIHRISIPQPPTRRFLCLVWSHRKTGNKKKPSDPPWNTPFATKNRRSAGYTYYLLRTQWVGHEHNSECTSYTSKASKRHAC